DDCHEGRAVRLPRGRELERHGRERSALQPGEYPRDESLVPVSRRRPQETGEPDGLLRVERDRRLRLVPAPDAEARMLRLGQVDRDAQAAVADVGVAAEVLHDLRPLRPAAVRAEAELVLHSSPTSTTAAHRAPSMPIAVSGQADAGRSGTTHSAAARRASAAISTSESGISTTGHSQKTLIGPGSGSGQSQEARTLRLCVRLEEPPALDPAAEVAHVLKPTAARIAATGAWRPVQSSKL